MKWLRVCLLPPGWDASPSQGYPPASSSAVPIYNLGGGRHCESNLSCTRTQHNVPPSPPGQVWNQTARSGVERNNHEATARQAFYPESDIFYPLHATEPLGEVFCWTKHLGWIWRNFYWRIEEWFLEIAEKKTTSRQYFQTLKIFLLRIPISSDFPRGILCLKASHFVNLPGFSRSM